MEDKKLRLLENLVFLSKFISVQLTIIIGILIGCVLSLKF